jgi:hypothetical protein
VSSTLRRAWNTVRLWPARIRQSGSWAAARAVGRFAQPVWWVARGWAVFMLMYHHVVPVNPADFFWLVVVVAASIALGKVRWSQRHWSLRVGMAVVNVWLVWAVIVGWDAALPVTASPWPESWAEPEILDSRCAAPGGDLCFDGVPVTNIFAYDADGRPIPVVQLLDAEGRALIIGGEWTELVGAGALREISRRAVPRLDDGGRPVWNAYPWRSLSEETSNGSVIKVEEQEPAFPRSAIDPLPTATEAVADPEAPADATSSADPEASVRPWAPTQEPTDGTEPAATAESEASPSPTEGTVAEATEPAATEESEPPPSAPEPTQ